MSVKIVVAPIGYYDFFLISSVDMNMYSEVWTYTTDEKRNIDRKEWEK